MNEFIIWLYHKFIIGGFWLVALMMLIVVVLYGKVWVCGVASRHGDVDDD